MNKCIVDVTKLTNLCITRNRGKEAALKLSSYIDNCQVELDLRNAELVSLSFLDELVCHYLDFVNKGTISFITNDKQIDSKLSEIATVRSVTIRCRNSQNKKYVVSTKRFLSPIPTFVESKG